MKSYRHVQIQLSFNSKEPIYQQIKAYIINEIVRGRLLPGALLPGSRVLAQQLKVNRNTVMLVYDQLIAAGWLTSHYKSGTRVNDSMPAGHTGPPGQELPSKPALHIPFRHVNISLSPSNPNGNYDIIFDDGLPDLKLTPIAEITKECRRLVQQDDQRVIYNNTSERGNEYLLQEINTMLNNDRGLAATMENICITQGVQMALYLTAQTLLAPGDHIAVEHPGYQPAWQAFTMAGAQLHYIHSDQHGINLEELELRCQLTQLKALYITPHHQYPTTSTLSIEKRQQLLTLSERYNFMIIEDDYDHEFHFHSHHIPLAGMPHADNVIYIGSVMQTLPISFVCGPVAFIRSLAAYRSIVNREGDPVLQQAIANLMITGDIRKHIHNTRSVYMKRLELTNNIIHSSFAGQAHYTRPQGGLAIWLQLYKQVDPKQLLQKVQSAGINIVNPLSYYHPQFSHAPGLRLGYASMDETGIIKGLGKLAKVIQQL
jgi:GntR family transcriptional regulator/MocR family aminotransferase